MRLSPREKRTVRAGAVVIVAYLTLFFGHRAWLVLEAKRARADELRQRADQLGVEILREEVKARRLRKLREDLRLDLGSLREERLVAEASSALQEAARAHGLQLGPSRETSGRRALGELAALQIEGAGTTAAATRFLHDVATLGVPVLLESLDWKRAGNKPGNIQLSLRLAVLAPAAWTAPASTPEGTSRE